MPSPYSVRDRTRIKIPRRYSKEDNQLEFEGTSESETDQDSSVEDTASSAAATPLTILSSASSVLSENTGSLTLKATSVKKSSQTPASNPPASNPRASNPYQRRYTSTSAERAALAPREIRHDTMPGNSLVGNACCTNLIFLQDLFQPP
jgi:hypothetical protein